MQSPNQEELSMELEESTFLDIFQSNFDVEACQYFLELVDNALLSSIHVLLYQLLLKEILVELEKLWPCGKGFLYVVTSLPFREKIGIHWETKAILQELVQEQAITIYTIWSQPICSDVICATEGYHHHHERPRSSRFETAIISTRSYKESYPVDHMTELESVFQITELTVNTNENGFFEQWKKMIHKTRKHLPLDSSRMISDIHTNIAMDCFKFKKERQYHMKSQCQRGNYYDTLVQCQEEKRRKYGVCINYHGAKEKYGEPVLFEDTYFKVKAIIKGQPFSDYQ